MNDAEGMRWVENLVRDRGFTRGHVERRLAKASDAVLVAAWSVGRKPGAPADTNWQSGGGRLVRESLDEIRFRNQVSGGTSPFAVTLENENLVVRAMCVPYRWLLESRQDLLRQEGK